MNVLHIGPKNYPPAHGGVEKSVFDIIKYSQEINSHIFVEWDQEEKDNIKVLPKGLFRQIKFIKEYSKSNSIDIVHFNKEAFIPLSIFFQLFSSVKIVHSIRGCAWRLKRWKWYYRIIFYILDLLACAILNKTVFVGKEDYSHFSKIIFWRKLVFIPNGVEKNDFIASKDKRECVFIGRISPEKNILRLIQIFKDRDQNLSMYGPFDKHNPSYKDLVLNEIEKLNNVKYRGVIDFKDIPEILSNYNTFFNISFSEGMPVSVLEAASVGLNLVLSNIPQHKDLNFPDVVYLNPNKPNLDFHFLTNSISNKEYLNEHYLIEQTVSNYKEIYSSLIIGKNEK